MDFKGLCTLAEIKNIDHIEEVYRLLKKVDFKDKFKWNEVLNLCVKIYDRLIEINGNLVRIIVNYVLQGFVYLPVIIKDYGSSLDRMIKDSENEMIDFFLELI